MGMTMRERRGRAEIIRRLARDGYPKYAKLLKEFDLRIVNDDGFTACIRYDKGEIVINGNIDDQKSLSVVIRHELLHGFLQHNKRLINHVAKILGYDPQTLDGEDLEKVIDLVYSEVSPHNIVADYDISNQGYTEDDKDTVRALVINSEILTGLVTEDHHADWVNLSLEEMWDKAMEERQKTIDEISNKLEIEYIEGDLSDDGRVFVDEDGVEYGF